MGNLKTECFTVEELVTNKYMLHIDCKELKRVGVSIQGYVEDFGGNVWQALDEEGVFDDPSVIVGITECGPVNTIETYSDTLEVVKCVKHKKELGNQKNKGKKMNIKEVEFYIEEVVLNRYIVKVDYDAVKKAGFNNFKEYVESVEGNIWSPEALLGDEEDDSSKVIHKIKFDEIIDYNTSYFCTAEVIEGDDIDKNANLNTENTKGEE